MNFKLLWKIRLMEIRTLGDITLSCTMLPGRAKIRKRQRLFVSLVVVLLLCALLNYFDFAPILYICIGEQMPKIFFVFFDCKKKYFFNWVSTALQLPCNSYKKKHNSRFLFVLRLLICYKDMKKRYFAWHFFEKKYWFLN